MKRVTTLVLGLGLMTSSALFASSMGDEQKMMGHDEIKSDMKMKEDKMINHGMQMKEDNMMKKDTMKSDMMQDKKMKEDNMMKKGKMKSKM